MVDTKDCWLKREKKADDEEKQGDDQESSAPSDSFEIPVLVNCKALEAGETLYTTGLKTQLSSPIGSENQSPLQNC